MCKFRPVGHNSMWIAYSQRKSTWRALLNSQLPLQVSCWLYYVTQTMYHLFIFNKICSERALYSIKGTSSYTSIVTPQLYLCATRWSSLAFYPYVYYRSASPFPYRTTSAVAAISMLSRYSFLLRWYCSPTASPSSLGHARPLCFPIMVTFSHARAASLLVPSSILSCTRVSVLVQFLQTLFVPSHYFTALQSAYF